MGFEQSGYTLNGFSVYVFPLSITTETTSGGYFFHFPIFCNFEPPYPPETLLNDPVYNRGLIKIFGRDRLTNRKTNRQSCV